MKTKLLSVFVLLGTIGNAQNISTIAGVGTAGYNGDNISATSAWLNCPQGVALDPAGSIYIGDLCGNRIRKVDYLTGIITNVAGTGTAGYNGDNIAATVAQISNPSALAFDVAGNLYFTDRSNSRIRKITISTGIITTVAGTGVGGYNGDGILATNAQLASPNEVSFDSSGNLYIADWLNHRVRKITTSTGIISTIAGTGSAGYNGDGIPSTTAQLYNPFSIYFDQPKCNMYIGDYGSNRVRKITGGFVGCTPLALSLLSFYGEHKGSYNLLQWKIAGE